METRMLRRTALSGGVVLEGNPQVPLRPERKNAVQNAPNA